MFGGGCNAGMGASNSAEYLQSPRDKEPVSFGVVVTETETTVQLGMTG